MGKISFEVVEELKKYCKEVGFECKKRYQIFDAAINEMQNMLPENPTESHIDLLKADFKSKVDIIKNDVLKIKGERNIKDVIAAIYNIAESETYEEVQLQLISELSSLITKKNLNELQDSLAEWDELSLIIITASLSHSQFMYNKYMDILYNNIDYRLFISDQFIAGMKFIKFCDEFTKVIKEQFIKLAIQNLIMAFKFNININKDEILKWEPYESLINCLDGILRRYPGEKEAIEKFKKFKDDAGFKCCG